MFGRLAIIGLSAWFVVAPARADERIERGAYLARIMDCGGCHTPGVLLGKPDHGRMLGGSEVGFQLPGLGTFYPPNLTPHETGLGAWSENEIVTAIRTGVRPDGRTLAPIMPWHSYAALTDEDADALAGYLKTLTAVDHRVPALVAPDAKATAPFLAVTMP
jgi:mono/diheme cytochrome c family protein